MVHECSRPCSVRRVRRQFLSEGRLEGKRLVHDENTGRNGGLVIVVDVFVVRFQVVFSVFHRFSVLCHYRLDLNCYSDGRRRCRSI
jgi:hypothetical protein